VQGYVSFGKGIEGRAVPWLDRELHVMRSSNGRGIAFSVRRGPKPNEWPGHRPLRSAQQNGKREGRISPSRTDALLTPPRKLTAE